MKNCFFKKETLGISEVEEKVRLKQKSNVEKWKDKIIKTK